MEDYKLKSIETEEQLVLSHRDEIIELNKMLEKLKQDQERQYKQFDAVNKKYAQEKLYLIEDLKSKHRLDIEGLKQTYSSNKDDFQAEKRKLEEKNEAELIKLKTELETLNGKSQKDKQEYEQNILKLKTFHQRELEANRQNSTGEYEKLIQSLKSDFEILDKQKLSIENELTQKYNRKLEELVAKEEEIKNLNLKIEQLNKNVEDSSRNFSELNSKIIELTSKNQQLHSKIAELEHENGAMKDKTELQDRQLIDKASEISKLEASSMQQVSTISDLKHELKQTKKRLALLEEERKNLETQSYTQNDRNTHLIKNLETRIELLNEEKKSIENDLNSQLNTIKDLSQKDLDKLKADTQFERQELIDNYESRLGMEKALYQEKILTLERVSSTLKKKSSFFLVLFQMSENIILVI